MQIGLSKNGKTMGRPTAERKAAKLQIRLSETDEKMLGRCCEAYGLTKAEVIRLGIKELYEKT